MATYDPVDSPDATTLFPYHSLTPPTLHDIYQARQSIAPFLPRTPLVRSEWLSDLVDADVYLKREDTLPTGAFKVRGGLTLVSQLDEEFKSAGLIAASTGNHGQSIAYAGRSFDVPVIIGIPESANPGKVAAMERLGAQVEHHGEDYDEAREWVESTAAAEGYRYVHSANEPDLIAGVATAGLEIVEDQPDVDLVFSPVGGGSSAAGYCLSVGEVCGASIIGVQSAAAPAVYQAWSNGHLEPATTMETFAEGLATRVPFALTTRLLRQHLADFVCLPDTTLRDCMYEIGVHEHIFPEAAGAAGIAGLLEKRDLVAGKTVVVPISGRNIGMDTLRSVLDS